LNGPFLFDSLIANISLYGMDIHRAVDMITVASRFAGFYTNPAHHSGEWVILYDCLERFKIISGLRMSHPSLDIFPRRACTVTGWHKINI
jgi:hypothetical protein